MIGLKGASLLGVGLSTYTSSSLDTESDLEAPAEFKRKDAVDGEYANATVENGVVTLDTKARAEWSQRLNTYYKDYLKEEMLKPEWKTMDTDTKKEIIAEVRQDARKDARADMIEMLEIEGLE